MYHSILNKLGLKRLPPLLIPIGIPFIVLAVLGIMVYLIFYWLFGFWQCSECGKHHWIIHDRKATKDTKNDMFKEWLCDSCQTMNALTKEDKDHSKIVQSGSPIY